MKILVTGGAGFIGTHLCRLLAERGAKITVLDNLSSGIASRVPSGAELVEADVTGDAPKKILAAGGFDAVVHLAAQTMVDVSMKRPEHDAKTNIMGLVNVLEAMRAANTKRIVFASTAAVYGDVAENLLPITETNPHNPLSFYALSKATAENYLKLYNEAFGIEYAALRFANVYGEWQGDGGEGGVISIFAKRIAAGKGITIFGDGKQTRDFVYAGDVAEGIFAALTAENVNDVYNLSTATETSLIELTELFGEVAGKKIAPLFAAARQGDIRRSALAAEKAGRLLAWRAKVSLRDGLRRTYDYFLRRENEMRRF